MFALFAGEAHYPAGGWDDLVGAYDSIQKAIGAADNYERNANLEWGHIVNLTTARPVLVWAVVSEYKRATKTRPAQPVVWGWVTPSI